MGARRNQKKPFITKILWPMAVHRYRHMQVIYDVDPGEEPAVFISNHAKIDGPSGITTRFNRPHYCWTIGASLEKVSARSYMFHDVFLGNSRAIKWPFRALSRVLAPHMAAMLSHENVIAVYHDSRSFSAFRESVEKLQAGNDIVIFGESPKPYSDYVNELQDGFLLLGPQYYKKTGKCIRFFPVYVCRKNNEIHVGKPISYDPGLSLSAQRETIRNHLESEITRVAQSMKPHKPIHFMDKRWYKAYGQYENDFSGYWRMIDEEAKKRFGSKKRSEHE